ncbi:MAG TPA: hypothetical protein VEU11_05350, partial [Terriglobales bacterium]|nr:hypothetical protein [Terriglobales bacterium]
MTGLELAEGSAIDSALPRSKGDKFMNKCGWLKSLIVFAASTTLALTPNPALAQRGGHGGGGGGGFHGGGGG